MSPRYTSTVARFPLHTTARLGALQQVYGVSGRLCMAQTKQAAVQPAIPVKLLDGITLENFLFPIVVVLVSGKCYNT